ncbi:hypothetical protein HOY34_17205 [Xinfangfangia sp. D13-10-4-6]|uniref:hypothetical protein n=1 Tax=Pseudogemmobacter hezensis TaxID=2737662 RepID=UPI001555572B|nr:hypothetical protein [Pseudogemmobacter hezensis]NPD16933.1 hypothetical protein [Pseudogemmobacter hezensis]
MTMPVAPIEFRSLPKAQQFSFERVVEKVVASCVIKGLGKDLLLQVYLAGLYHGSQSAAGWPAAQEKGGG